MEQKFYICKHCGNILPGRDPQPGGKRFYLPKCVNTRIFSLTQSKRPQKHYISEVLQHFG